MGAKEISVGLLGLGTVGMGVVKLLRENAALIEKRLGAKLTLKRIADIDPDRPRPVAVPREILTTDARSVIGDPGISIIVELIGGFEPARTFILEALGKRKAVVTANKALLATYGSEIFRAAVDNGAEIGFEASVGGTIPVIKTLRESLAGNRIHSIFGIMNGTSNFILSKMTDEGLPFEEALKTAQKLGFAEADPTYDIEGIDTAHKLAIALSLSYGKRVRLEEIHREGISRITGQDVEFARELGYKIKLLAIAFERGDRVEARIHPTMIPFDHLLASVNGNFNAFHFIGDASGSVFLYGQGAGMDPTASAVVSDLMDISRDILNGVSGRIPPRTVPEDQIEDMRILPMEDIVTNYFFRFTAVDRPGVLSKISGILGRYDISIAAVIQKGRKLDGVVPVVMTTHMAKEKAVRKALKEIDRLDVVGGDTVVIRIEDERLR
ncbi:MAG TPA: homoserine dehydrogenase [Syntrophales bacterium]|nr:homoserine dehydrogenase [Syntrophales bacterium]HPX11704.1 homoserine dehydrogenase [Syntrophales bacterium]HQB29744.1 homoserine dehydrogenase [Syntrophales bacterium]HQN76714.1 homoserine dehydrogenase [Syntrophales bacterium]HQQ26067.1 homoserine dehydrogenase [Syntrophales bacterium]